MTAKEICSHRLTIVTGHYGTGKTEFSVNLALALAGEGEQVMMADLDIVNPYFRSRERKALLEDAGIRLICSSQACSDADVPALPAEVLTILENRDVRGVLDIGGDPVGARVLARFRPKILQEDHQLVYVLNANRPEVRAPENASVTYTPADLTSAEKYEIRCAESWLPLMIKTRLPIAASSETKRSNSATASACGIARW